MALNNTIYNIVGSLSPCPYRITVLGSSGAHVEGVIKVESVCLTKIILKTKCYSVVLYGENLYVKSIIDEDVNLLGKINKIEVL